MVFAGGIKGTAEHKAAHHKARHKANYYADQANKNYEIRDTFKNPTV
jgi:hypothetical protein